MLVALTHTLYQEFDMTKTIRKGIEMKHKDLSLDTIMCLQRELEEALENYWHFLDVGDFNLSQLWIEQADIIVQKMKEL